MRLGRSTPKVQRPRYHGIDTGMDIWQCRAWLQPVSNFESEFREIFGERATSAAIVSTIVHQRSTNLYELTLVKNYRMLARSARCVEVSVHLLVRNASYAGACEAQELAGRDPAIAA